MKIFSKQQLIAFQDMPVLINRIEQGFAAYSQGQVNIPPVCHMHFKKPLGDLHIKCASKAEEEYYAVKVASCFPENKQLGLPSIQGMMLLFSQLSGHPAAIFLDEGYLTHLRTAIAGAICAKYFAPKNPQAIGIIGAGAQARFQLDLLRHVTDCRQAWVWAPNRQAMEEYRKDERLKDFDIRLAESPQEAAKHCRLIVTTTPALSPLLFARDIQAGTHITAVGSDRPGKQELDPCILELAHRVVVDSREQCFQYGETFCAIQADRLSKNRVDEIGEVILGQKSGRMNDNEITVADLTGLGIQDLEIAQAFYAFLNNQG